MGLKMTLPMDKNHLHHEFEGAYWAIDTLVYDMEFVSFSLISYESRECKLINGTTIENPSIDDFGCCQPLYRTQLYSWTPRFHISEVFPEGVPLGRDAQLKVIYSFIKTHTGLPFEDVFEDDQIEDEPIVEPTEPTEEPIDEPSAADEVADEETVTEEATETTEEETEDVE